MSIPRRTFIAALGSAPIMALQAQRALAAYPDRPIHLIVPFAAGGNADIVGRITGDLISKTRPTAVNLFWAIRRMQEKFERIRIRPIPQIKQALIEEAKRMHAEDIAANQAMGRHGATLMPSEGGVLTHCNAGGLATADYGTALAVLFTAHEQGKALRVFADETRPLLQGARLTAWELQQRGIATTLICDNMAAQVMKEGRIQLVVVGADRIAANGDTANKIGTYGVALLARAHGIPFYVAAPSSTFDLSLADGTSIPIEQRDPREVTDGFGRPTAPEGVSVYNPAFDVTDAALVTALVTEYGIVQPVSAGTLHDLGTTSRSGEGARSDVSVER